jgi:hypothetical protein
MPSASAGWLAVSYRMSAQPWFRIRPLSLSLRLKGAGNGSAYEFWVHLPGGRLARKSVTAFS